MTKEEKTQISNHIQKIGGIINLKKKSSHDLELTEVYSFLIFFNFWEIKKILN